MLGTGPRRRRDGVRLSLLGNRCLEWKRGQDCALLVPSSRVEAADIDQEAHTWHKADVTSGARNQLFLVKEEVEWFGCPYYKELPEWPDQLSLAPPSW